MNQFIKNEMNKRYLSPKIIKSIGLILSVTFVALLVVMAAQAQWEEPSQGPPGGNVAPPINVGDEYQTKQAGLGIEGNLDVDGTVQSGAWRPTGTNDGRIRRLGGQILYEADDNWYWYSSWNDQNEMKLHYRDGLWIRTWAEALDFCTHDGVCLKDLSASRLTGSGSSGQVTFWTGSSSLGGSNNFYWDSSNNRLGIGSTSVPGFPSYRLHVQGDIYANGGWLRVSGTKGLYFQSYGGGWHMTDSNWIRAYNNKNIYTGGQIRSGSSMRAPIFYDHNDPYFYVNPAGTSRMKYLEVGLQDESRDEGGEINMRGTTHNWYIDVNGTDFRWHHSGDTKMRLDTDGDLYIDRAYHCNGADIAEKTPSEEALSPGEVVSLSVENEGKLRKSRSPYEKEVAGVVSTEPGMILGDEMDSIEIDGVELALAGRVHVKVTSENGSIEVGDLLVSSSRPGYAMRGDLEIIKERPGVIIGKAMESLQSGEGEILVLINLQ